MKRPIKKDNRGLFSLLGGLGVAVPLIGLALLRNPPMSVAQSHALHHTPYAWSNRRSEEALYGVYSGFFGSLGGYGVAVYLRRRRQRSDLSSSSSKGIWPPPPSPPAV